MKKNIMMRAASGLAVATLLTTSLIGGTFAKYTTTAEGSDTARVAKWGVTATVQNATFATAYDNADTPTVKSSTIENVVAPGTKGNLAGITLSGTPEVKVKVTYNGEFSLSGKWEDANGTYYCPLKVTVNSTIIDGATCTSSSDFVKKVNDAINGYSQEYGVNTDLSTKTNDNLKVSWEWPYETTGNDEKDTTLGNETTDVGKVTLKVTTTVTQVD